MYVKVFMNEPLWSRHKTSSWWVSHLACFISATCMSKSSSPNHLCHNIKPLLGGFYNLLVFHLCYMYAKIHLTEPLKCIPKSSSQESSTSNCNYFVCSFYCTYMTNGIICLLTCVKIDVF